MKYEQFAANARKAYGDVCEVGETLAHAKSVLAAVPDLVGKNERLEKENAELKGEIEILQCIQQPTGNMELPLDADGVPIRIGDEMDVDGDVMTVIGYRRSFGRMLLITKDKSTGHIFVPDPSKVRRLKPEPADSWEKLEEDAKKRPCFYFDIDEDAASCDDCPYGSSRTGTVCWLNALLDMIARAKKLAGNEARGRYKRGASTEEI